MSFINYDWSDAFQSIINELERNQRNGALYCAPFYKKKPRNNLNTAQKIRVFRFIINLENSETIEYG